jgi:hypothetical protein
MDAQELVGHIINGRAVDAMETMQQVFAAKIAEKLEARKAEIAQSLYVEETEQIDEISTDTLRSYKKGAGEQYQSSIDAHGKAFSAGDTKTADAASSKALKRRAGWEKADDRINGGAAEKRFDGMKAARQRNDNELNRKYTREETEQIDEISTDTLNSYSSKAMADRKKLKDRADRYELAGAPIAAQASRDKADKRIQGAAKATGKVLKREEE